MTRLPDKIAVVTGAGSGIGRAIAETFAAEGATVILADKNLAGAQAVAAGIAEQGRTATAIACDVTSAQDVQHLFESARSEHGGLDVLVNCAGMGQLGTVTELDEATWDLVMAVNVKSIYLCSHHAIPLMRKRSGGRIINIASVSGITASAGRAAYTASKGAVVMLTRAMALDHAPDSINVNAICPGVVITAMTERSLQDPEVMAQKLRDTPLSRLAEPSEIAPAAVYLASADGSFVTGSALVVDGGWCA